MVSRKKEWQLIEKELKVQIENKESDSLFNHILLGEVREKTLHIFIASQFSKNRIETMYWNSLMEFIKNYTEYRDVDNFELIIAPERFKKENDKKATMYVKKKKQKSDIREEYPDIFKLNEKYTFENFVVGSSNEHANAASKAVSKEPGIKSNPLFIYGGSGLGKTHLMQAIGHYIQGHNPEKNVAYVTSEKFTNDFIESLSANNPAKFREKYRKIDILLVDDIQMLTGKTETQKEFHFTFDELVQKKKQIVLTSDKPPAKLEKLEDRLVSRFKSGLIADIQKPNLELRIAILQKQVQELQVEVDYELIEYIAQKVITNIRELESAFKNVISYKSLTGKDLNGKIIDNILKDFIVDIKRKYTVEEILSTVSEHYKVKVSDILSSRRDKNIVKPRQMAMYLSRDLTGYSLPNIAKEFGKKDHTTVLYACKKVEELIKKDFSTKKAFQDIRRKIMES